MDNKDFRFKKEFGQNFIFDKNFLVSLVKKLNLPPKINVLEIGSGMGTLTAVLAENFNKVVSFEIDKTLTEHLGDVQSHYDNLNIVFKDILSMDMCQVDNMFGGESYFMIANLPYYITSEIIFRFLLSSKNLVSMFVMVQKEVALRFCSTPSHKEYGIPSVLLDTFANCHIVEQVPRRMFTPQPNVDSAVIAINIDKTKFHIDREQNYCDFVSKCFAMKRKTLVNNLIKAGIDKEKITKALASYNIQLTSRPENLSSAQYVQLFNYFASSGLL